MRFGSYVSFASLVAFATFWGCFSRNPELRDHRSDLETKPTKASNAQNVRSPLEDARLQLASPELHFDTLMLGPLKVQRVYVESRGNREHHFEYDLCPSGGSQGCTKGTVLWGAALFPELQTGSYSMSMKACNETGECGYASNGEVKQEPNVGADPELVRMVSSQIAITREIKGKADPVHAALQEYLKAMEEAQQPPDVFSAQIEDQVAYGPLVTAEVLNSSRFPLFYRKFYGDAALPPGLVSEEEKNEADAENSEARNLERRIGTLEGNSSSSADENAKQASGAIVASLGVSVVLVGAAVTAIAWYLPRTMKSITDWAEASAKTMRGLSKTTEAAVAAAFDAVRKIVHPAFAGVLMNENFLKAKYGPDLDWPRPIPTTDTLGGQTLKVLSKNRAGGIAYVIAQNGLVYEKGTGMLESSHKIKDGYTIRTQDFNQLSEAEKGDFEPGKRRGTHVLKADALKNYVVLDGKTYRLTWPMTDNFFPKLSPQTVNYIYQRWVSMLHSPDPSVRASAATDFAKGVPLFDVHGRLVEPPESWKVPRKNWFVNVKTIKQAVPTQRRVLTAEDEAEMRRIDAEFGDIEEDDSSRRQSINEPQVKPIVEPRMRNLGDVIDMEHWKQFPHVPESFPQEIQRSGPYVYEHTALVKSTEIVVPQGRMARAGSVLSTGVKQVAGISLQVFGGMFGWAGAGEASNLGAAIRSDEAGSVRNYLTGDVHWSVELNLRFQEIEAMRIAEQRAAAFEVQMRDANTGIRTSAAQIQTGATIGKYTGLGMMAVGFAVTAIGTMMTQGLLLAGSPQDALLGKLRAIEKEVTDLHRKRLEELAKLNLWLRTNQYPVPDKEWAYHL